MQSNKEITSLVRTFIPHESNSFKHKITLIALLLMWIILETVNVTMQMQTPAPLEWIRPLVIGIMARQWGRERERVEGDE